MGRDGGFWLYAEPAVYSLDAVSVERGKPKLDPSPLRIIAVALTMADTLDVVGENDA